MVDLKMGYFDSTKVEPIYLGSSDKEKTILVNEKEYKSLLITKGKYEQLLLLCDKILLFLSPNDIQKLMQNIIKKQ